MEDITGVKCIKNSRQSTKQEVAEIGLHIATLQVQPSQYSVGMTRVIGWEHDDWTVRCGGLRGRGLELRGRLAFTFL